jgi:hypothetical protein
MTTTRILAAILALAAAPGGVRAGEGERVLVDGGARLSFGGGYGGPVGAVAGVDLLVGPRIDVRDGPDRVKGVLGGVLGLQVGTRGGKLSLGAGAQAKIRSDDFRGPVGAALKLSLVRTWDDPGGRRGTYLGPEVELGAMHVNLTLGVLGHLGGPGGPVAFSWGLGLRI